MHWTEFVMTYANWIDFTTKWVVEAVGQDTCFWVGTTNVRVWLVSVMVSGNQLYISSCLDQLLLKKIGSIWYNLQNWSNSQAWDIYRYFHFNCIPVRSPCSSEESIYHHISNRCFADIAVPEICTRREHTDLLPKDFQCLSPLTLFWVRHSTETEVGCRGREPSRSDAEWNNRGCRDTSAVSIEPTTHEHCPSLFPLSLHTIQIVKMSLHHPSRGTPVHACQKLLHADKPMSRLKTYPILTNLFFKTLWSYFKNITGR